MTILRPDSILGENIGADVPRVLPEHFCRTFQVVPFDLVDGVLQVAAVTDDDEMTARVIAQLTDMPVELVAFPAEDIAYAITSMFADDDPIFEGPTLDDGDHALGSSLVELGLITPEEFASAAIEHAATGDPIGDILVANGVISQTTYISVLAERSELQRVRISEDAVDFELARQVPEKVARRLGVLPVARDEDLVFLAATRPLSDEDLIELSEYIGFDTQVLLATKASVDQLTQRAHRDEYAWIAPNLLRNVRPDESAHIVATTGQKVFFTLVLLAVIVCAIIWPKNTAIGFVGFCSAVYLAVSAYRFRLTYRALGRHYETAVTQTQLEHVDDHLLPIYTILVPLYKEARIVGRLVHAIEAMDYPRTKLDVKLLCEEDDEDTIEAIRVLDLPPHFHLVVVPDGQPKTKPKACNYGLLLAEGKYTVIYDAEDRPDPDQLKKAVIAFTQVADNVACVQAKLNYFNGRQNVLTSWFANEYSMHYELVLPAMGHDEVPIPLGGTSNHFITEKLREIGAWDPYNVTEDADLGIRLHREGYRTAIMDSTTLEEANSVLPNWIRQRSRWIKGYMQTWLVHMRNPFKLLRKLGVRSFVSFNLTVGGAFIHLINPIFWALTTAYVLTETHVIRELFPGFIFYAAAAMLFIGNFIFVFINAAGSLHRGQFELTRFALISPIYWGLMSLAAWKGFIQLFTNPFYWEKTEHGIDTGNH